MESSFEEVEREVLGNLIDLYRSNQMLWDPSSPLYFNKDARNQAYETLLAVYQQVKGGATIKDVKRKIDNMRTTYKKELKKVKEAAAAGEHYVPSLWYYEHLRFLDGKDVVRAGTDSADAWEEEEIPTAELNPESLKIEVVDNHLKGNTKIANVSSSEREQMQSNPTASPSNTPQASSISTISLPFVLQNGSQNVLLPSNSLPIILPNAPQTFSLPTNVVPNPAKKFKHVVNSEQNQKPDNGTASANDSDCGAFGVTMVQQLQGLRPLQQAIAQKLISDVLFYGKLNELTPTALVMPKPSSPSTTNSPQVQTTCHPDIHFNAQSQPIHYLDTPASVSFHVHFNRPHAAAPCTNVNSSQSSESHSKERILSPMKTNHRSASRENHSPSYMMVPPASHQEGNASSPSSPHMEQDPLLITCADDCVTE